MIPTNGQVYNLAREFLGDTEVPGGQLFKNPKLRHHLQTAYGEMIRALGLQNNSLLRRHGHFNMPAYQSVLYPAQIGIQNFGEPYEIRERKVTESRTVTAVTPGDGYVDLELNSAHGLADGASLVVYKVGGITDDINREWVATVPTATSVRLLGSRATGTYTSGGVVSWSTEPWSQPLKSNLDLVDMTLVSSSLESYAWRGDALNFRPCNEIRQIKVVFSPSGVIGVNKDDSLFVDDSLDFLGHRTAGLAGGAAGGRAAGRARELNVLAIGRDLDLDHPGGKLGELISIGVKSLQRNRYPIAAWRDTMYPRSDAYILP